MTTAVIVIVVVVVLAALVGGGLALARKKRSDQLREEFGPEYDRVLEQSGSKGEAESELAERRKRHDELELRSLDEGTRERFRSDWKRIQGEFVDDPGDAVDRADHLVTAIMRERGYPVDEFDQRADDISVEHPQVVQSYRRARQVRDEHRHGTAGTEDLRGAVTSYRDLVEALLDESGDRRGERAEHGERGRERGADDDRGRHRENGHARREPDRGSSGDTQQTDGSRR